MSSKRHKVPWRVRALEMFDEPDEVCPHCMETPCSCLMDEQEGPYGEDE